MKSIFPVDTVVSRACVSEDINYYIRVCAIVQCIRYVATNFIKQNVLGHVPQVECHTFARIIKILMPELKLINGYYAGIVFNSEKANLVLMKHSWLTTPCGTIIDPHPCGILSLQVVVIVPRSNEINDAFGYNYYLENNQVLSEFDYRDSWKRARGLIRLFKNSRFNTEEIKKFAYEMVTLIKRKSPAP